MLLPPQHHRIVHLAIVSMGDAEQHCAQGTVRKGGTGDTQSYE